MSKGRWKKEFKKRIHFIQQELEKRQKIIASFELDTEINIQSAIKFLQAHIRYSDHLTIPVADFSQHLPKGYSKMLRRLKKSLQEMSASTAENQLQHENGHPIDSLIGKNSRNQIKKPLYEIPLFEGAQVVNWQQDCSTNQLNRLVVAINRGPGHKTCYNHVDNILSDIKTLWAQAQLPYPTTEQDYLFYWSLFQEAITKYAELEGINLFTEMPEIYLPIPEESRFQMFKQSFDNVDLILKEERSASTSLDDLERITDAYDNLEKAKLANKNKNHLTKEVIHKHLKEANTAVVINRLFVGCGFTSMTLMTTDPSVSKLARQSFEQLRNYLSNEGAGALFLDTLLISDKETGNWTHDDHRAEQEHPLLEIPGEINAGDFVPSQQSIERIKRTNTRHLFYAQTANMAAKDTPPPLFQVKVEELEKQLNHQNDWAKEAEACGYRVKVSIALDQGQTITTYIYAKRIDFALGMGVGQNTSFETAIQNEFSRHSLDSNSSKEMGKKILAQHSVYDIQRGYTPIIHGNDFDLSDRERQPISAIKNRRVVIIGGAGGAATAYRMSVLGTDKPGLRLQDKHGAFLQESENVLLNANVKIFARSRVNYNVLAKQATESFEYAKLKGTLYENYSLEGIRIVNEEIILRFHNKNGAKEITEENLQFYNNAEIVKDNGKIYLLNLHEEICDQLISGMGQDASLIRALIFKEITQDELKMLQGYDGHYVGMTTACGNIFFHGAMAGNLTSRFTADLAASLRKSNLPRNSNDQNIMPNVIPKLFSFFSSAKESSRRMCINVNTCFLQRGDLRSDIPTEFSIFLAHADLLQSEIADLVKFLMEQRVEDDTGAGVSNENLNLYINKSGLSDRIQVVSSCCLIATKDLYDLSLTSGKSC